VDESIVYVTDATYRIQKAEFGEEFEYNKDDVVGKPSLLKLKNLITFCGILSIIANIKIIIVHSGSD